LGIVLSAANVMKQNNSNLLSFQGNYSGNTALTTQNDSIIMEWELITGVKSFISLAPGQTGLVAFLG
jgi:hypothetical protein